GSPLKVEQGLITVDPETQATSVPGVFAGGSVTHGPATVIEALVSGRKAAAAMDVYLTGKARAEDGVEKMAEPFLKFNSDYLTKTHRVTMPKRPVAERSIAVEDTLGLGLSEIEGEANRCFNCGCVSVSPSDMGVVLVALGARVEIAGPRGVRTVAIEDLFGSLRTILEVDEMVTEIQVPQPADGARQTFLKFRLRESVDFPIVSVASVITIKDGICQDARIVLGAVAPAPVRATMAEQALTGKPINAKTVEAASQAAVTGAIPLEKNSYKVTIARELVRRAILPPEVMGK
ncbi:MAG TPA: FAD binding domain-containing protein, partial [Dehalococcoidia bacterium]|nr:FAD binding domain-containing protein [Dehalococcoidia bacterium]